MNVFDCAIKIEEEAKDYYMQLGSHTDNPQMRNLFAMLAASEEEHHATLMKMKQALPAEKAQVGELDTVVCRFRPVLTEEEFLEEMRDDPDFYLHAMREEEEEIRFYEELAKKTSDDATRACLMQLIQAERHHLSTVANIYDFVENPRSYLASGEFSNLRDL